MTGIYDNSPEDRMRERQLNKHLDSYWTPTTAEVRDAQAAGLLETLERSQAAAVEYTGLELIGEALGDHQYIDYRPLVDLIASTLRGRHVDEMFRDLDKDRLAEIVIGLIRPTLEAHAEKAAEAHLKHPATIERDDGDSE